MILNLDKLAKEDNILTLNKVDYLVPAEVPVGLVIKLQKAAQATESSPNDIDKIVASYDVVREIIALKNEDFMSTEELMNKLNTDQFVKLCNFIMGSEPEEEEVENPNKKKEDSD